MTRVLVVLDHYLPGFKAGGPIRSVANMVEALRNDLEFFILTRDRDFGDDKPYANVPRDSWQSNIFYMSSLGRIASAVAEVKPDVIYLNSVYSPASRRVILLRWLGRLPKTAIVLAPRGEFADGAMQFGRLKKWVYFLVTRLFRAYEGIVWHATTEAEIEEIARHAPAVSPRVKSAPLFATPALTMQRPAKEAGRLRALFVSRVSPKKNLDGLLRAMSQVRTNVALDIIGPIGDDGHWAACQRAIAALPAHVMVNYRGAIAHEEVLRELALADLFILPTHGENHGHAIVEALMAGCPVLISDRTPWRDLASHKAGWDLSLNDDTAMRDVIERVAAMDDAEHRQWREGATTFAQRIAADDAAIVQYKELFCAS